MLLILKILILNGDDLIGRSCSFAGPCMVPLSVLESTLKEELPSLILKIALKAKLILNRLVKKGMSWLSNRRSLV